MTDAVRITGLRDVQRALRQVDRTLPRELRKAGNAAAQVIVDEGKARATTPQQRKAAESLRPRSDQRGVRVALGNASRYPFALGAEFGSITYPQFPAFRGSGSGAGYFLWPAIRANRERVAGLFLDGVDTITRQAGLR